MELVNELISTYALPILGTILTAIASFVGMKIKSIYEKYINDKTKKDVVSTCVKAVEQIYTDIHGQQKYEKAVETITEVLTNKGITISDIEIKMLIEATCQSFVKEVKAE